MKAISVCVDYADFLCITLPRNVRHFERWLIVTSPRDTITQQFLAGVKDSRVECVVSDAFYRDGAAFNKGLAIEEAIDRLGRTGWMLCIDSDVVLPAKADFRSAVPCNLYGARRRMCVNPHRWDGGEKWDAFPVNSEGELGGFFHLFHGDDPVVRNRPLYGIRWRHGGGYDSEAEFKWPKPKKIRFPWQVLHLGEPNANWYGRATTRIDGSVPAEAAEKRRAMEQMRADRPHHGFAKEML